MVILFLSGMPLLNFFLWSAFLLSKTDAGTWPASAPPPAPPLAEPVGLLCLMTEPASEVMEVVERCLVREYCGEGEEGK